MAAAQQCVHRKLALLFGMDVRQHRVIHIGSQCPLAIEVQRACIGHETRRNGVHISRARRLEQLQGTDENGARRHPRRHLLETGHDGTDPPTIGGDGVGTLLDPRIHKAQENEPRTDRTPPRIVLLERRQFGEERQMTRALH